MRKESVMTPGLGVTVLTFVPEFSSTEDVRNFERF